MVSVCALLLVSSCLLLSAVETTELLGVPACVLLLSFVWYVHGARCCCNWGYQCVGGVVVAVLKTCYISFVERVVDV